MFASLNGGEKFTKLDLAHAYQQLLLDEDSRRLLTVNTHRGLFEPTRLQFGVNSATGIFQREMDKKLSHIPFVRVRVDDILITGVNDDEHLNNLSLVLKILKDCGLRLKQNKCEFMVSDVVYLGFKINKHGVIPLGEKIHPIIKAPIPENVTQLKSFLGMLNYYHRYLPQIANVLEPLHELLRKDVKWRWGVKQTEAYETAKRLLCSSELLIHYDPERKLVLHCDASPYGIGAVLSHVSDDETDRPVAFTSRSLSKAERNYSQIEREALAIIYAVKKFHQYLYGRHFHLVTDHKPLLGLLSEGKPIPSMCAARMQRWALLLASYDYTLEYRKGIHNGNADCLSRLPQKETVLISHAENHIMMMELSSAPIVFKDVQAYSKSDPVISRVIDFVVNGESSYINEAGNSEINKYMRRFYELTVEDGTLLRGNRVIIPPTLRDTVLNELHDTHPGICRMKALARSYVWWPGIDNDIETLVKECEPCQHHQNMPQTAPLHKWELPNRPWSKLHMDFAGPFLGKMFLIVVDSFSKWVDVFPMPSSANAPHTIGKLRSLFSTHGLPEIVVTDNASCFKCEEFGSFLEKNNIRHVPASPYHPATNGLAERAVQTFKKTLKKLLESSASHEDIETLINRLLFAYRITPHSVTGVSPSMLLMGRELNNHLSAMKPNRGKNKRIEKAKTDGYLHTRTRLLCRQDLVWVRNYANGPKWIKGMIERVASPVSYDVGVKGGVVKRHIDQLRLRVDNNIYNPVEYKEPVREPSTPLREPSILRDNERGNIIHDEVSEHSTIRDEIPVVNITLDPENGVQIPDNTVTEIIQPRRSSRIKREPDRLIYQ